MGGLNELTDGKGPEKCIDCIGMESHVTLSKPDTVYDRMKQMMMVESDRPHVLREMIYVCRPGGILSIPGVYGGLADKIPMGQLMNKGLSLRAGQTHAEPFAGRVAVLHGLRDVRDARSLVPRHDAQTRSGAVIDGL